MIRSLLSIATVLLTVPYISLQVGHHFQKQISSADNSATPWRRARLSYRLAKFSPFLWNTATKAEDETDLILSDFFFSEVLRGEQDAIVPQNHLDFLSDRPDNDTWNAIRGRTLLQYGQFSDALTLAQSQKDSVFSNIQAVSALYTGDKDTLMDGCAAWVDCPKGWRHELPFDTSTEVVDIQSFDWSTLPDADQPIFVEWAIDQQSWNDEWLSAVLSHKSDASWQCATLALGTMNAKANSANKDATNSETANKDAFETTENSLITSSLDALWGTDGSEWWVSYGKLVQSVPCHPNRFDEALEVTPTSLHNRLKLLKAVAYTGLLNISAAQSTLKEIALNGPETTTDEKILGYHLRVLARELAGSTKGMEKYVALGMPHNKALFSIHLGKAKLYEQAKTTAIQTLSALNGYPIPPQLQQEYADMLMLSKRLNGSASKIQIGEHALEYDFMDNDAEFREWLVQYHGQSFDQPTGSPMTIPLLRFWRGEDKHADQLLQTHLESTIHPLSVMMSTHQRFLEASLRNDKALTSTTWKQFAKTRAWLDDVPYPQMLRTHPEWFRSPWLHQ